MMLKIKSSLGNTVFHDCFNHAGNYFVTKSLSRLIFRVIGDGVYLCGGSSEWEGEKHKWITGKFHKYDPPKLIGSLIE